MVGKRFIVLVHGIGGPSTTERWRDPVNATLAALQMPSLDPSVDEFVNVDYFEVLKAGSAEEAPERTWKPPDEQEQFASWRRFLERKDALESLIDEWRKLSPEWPLRWAPDKATSTLAHGLSLVHRYLSDAGARNAVWDSVLGQFPQEGRAVIVAHSLGSIVMLDLLTRLPQKLHVDLFLTVGSPVGIGALRAHHGGLDRPEGFPANRVDAWVNVYDPDDVVTVGRGAERHFEAALDVPIDTGNSHHLEAYMSQPVVGGAIGITVFGPPAPEETGTPALNLHDQWWALVLRFAFTHALWSSWPKDEWKTRGQMDTARRVLAARTVAEIDRQRVRFEEQIELLPEPVRTHVRHQLGERPFAPGRMPTVANLYRHAGEITRNQFSDDELILSGVDLLLSMPFSPFGIETDDERSAEALGYLVQRIRKDASGLSSKDFAEAIAKSVGEARKALRSRGVPWVPLLLGAGALILAATGVGLIAAAPAGLAGAAAITATLATFGPGGMVGGVATLAVLSGTSAALTTAGLALGSDERAEFARIQAALAEEIARMPLAAFRTAVAGLLAVQRARQLIGVEVFGDLLERTLLAIEATVLSEGALHRNIAPKADATHEWTSKGEVIAKALAWALETFSEEGLDAQDRHAVTKTIETGATLPALTGGVPKELGEGMDRTSQSD